MGNDAPIFGTADLLVRTLAARLPARPGYALTRILTPRIDAGRRRWLGERAAAAVLEYLEDPAAARATADRFVVELACDDLDGLAGTDPALVGRCVSHAVAELCSSLN